MMTFKTCIIQWKWNNALIWKKTTELKNNIPSEVVYPSCNSKKTTEVAILGLYKHLYHIPFLSGRKTGTSNCNQCKQTYIPQNMPASIKLAYFELKETTKRLFGFMPDSLAFNFWYL